MKNSFKQQKKDNGSTVSENKETKYSLGLSRKHGTHSPLLLRKFTETFWTSPDVRFWPRAIRPGLRLIQGSFAYGELRPVLERSEGMTHVSLSAEHYEL